MNSFEILTAEILKTMDEEGTPVTKAEAEEMAKMELKARNVRPRTRKKATQPNNRKVDEDKRHLLKLLINAIPEEKQAVKNETEFSFCYNSNSYTVKLIKHRPKK